LLYSHVACPQRSEQIDRLSSCRAFWFFGLLFEERGFCHAGTTAWNNLPNYAVVRTSIKLVTLVFSSAAGSKLNYFVGHPRLYTSLVLVSAPGRSVNSACSEALTSVHSLDLQIATDISPPANKSAIPQSAHLGPPLQDAASPQPATNIKRLIYAQWALAMPLRHVEWYTTRGGADARRRVTQYS